MLKVALIATLVGVSSMAMADSFWNHNGSVMRLSADGNDRTLTYEKPSKTMRNAGVTSGTVLFDGQRNGNRYSGTARVFSKYCELPLEYRVSGTVKNEKTIVMTGKREVFAKGCKATGRYTTDKLTFTYIRSE